MTNSPRTPMPRNFDFTSEEARLYDWWESHGWFKPEAAPPDAETYTISMPPPNVTGALHIGHALFVTLEDLMIRYERMRGKAALWVPGTDHAGHRHAACRSRRCCATKAPAARRVGREEFLRRTWEWKEEVRRHDHRGSCAAWAQAATGIASASRSMMACRSAVRRGVRDACTNRA